MRIPIYQIDAFASRVFAGNPAGVCPLEAWPEASLMQSIAAENNLAETAFFVGCDGEYAIRWFTPTTEIDLCGHATLASAWVIFNVIEPERQAVAFGSLSGRLAVARDGERLTLDFPVRAPEPCELSEAVSAALGRPPRELWAARDYMAVYDSEAEVRGLKPDLQRLAALDRFGMIVTAPGSGSDFVSRFFAPAQGIPEDPVTGSAHCTLVPYWARRLGRDRLHALQVSARGGELFCELRGDRVAISGHAVKYLEGSLDV